MADENKVKDNDNNNGDNGNNNSGNNQQNNGQNVNQQNNGNTNGTNAGNNNSSDNKTYTQSQINQLITDGQNKGRQDALAELGINPDDKRTVELIKSFIASQKTEEEKANEEKNQQAIALAEANQRAVIAEAKAEAMVFGVQSQFVDDVVTLAMAKVNADKSDLKTVLGELKTKYPVWFESTNSDDKNNVGKRGTGGTVSSASGNDNNEQKTLGARLAAKRKSNVKSSFFGK